MKITDRTYWRKLEKAYLFWAVPSHVDKTPPLPRKRLLPGMEKILKRCTNGGMIPG
jgi:hypothetical protein